MKNKIITPQSKVILGEPKRKYRIIIQERKLKNNKDIIEKCRSFMLYDYTGKSSIDKLKKKLIERLYRFVK